MGTVMSLSVEQDEQSESVNLRTGRSSSIIGGAGADEETVTEYDPPSESGQVTAQYVSENGVSDRQFNAHDTADTSSSQLAGAESKTMTVGVVGASITTDEESAGDISSRNGEKEAAAAAKLEAENEAREAAIAASNAAEAAALKAIEDAAAAERAKLDEEDAAVRKIREDAAAAADRIIREEAAAEEAKKAAAAAAAAAEAAAAAQKAKEEEEVAAAAKKAKEEEEAVAAAAAAAAAQKTEEAKEAETAVASDSAEQGVAERVAAEPAESKEDVPAALRAAGEEQAGENVEHKEEHGSMPGSPQDADVSREREPSSDEDLPGPPADEPGVEPGAPAAPESASIVAPPPPPPLSQKPGNSSPDPASAEPVQSQQPQAGAGVKGVPPPRRPPGQPPRARSLTALAPKSASPAAGPFPQAQHVGRPTAASAAVGPLREQEFKTAGAGVGPMGSAIPPPKRPPGPPPRSRSTTTNMLRAHLIDSRQTLVAVPTLEEAIESQSLAAVQMAFDKGGADPNRSVRGLPALMGAAHYGNLDIVKLLLLKGADASERIGTASAATVAEQEGHFAVAALVSGYEKGIWAAADYGNAEVVAWLLANNRDLVRRINEHDKDHPLALNTALMIAAKHNEKEMVKTLLQYKADPLLQNKLGQRAADLTTDDHIRSLLQ